MTIKCRTLSFSLICVIILNTVNIISHQHHCQYHHHQQPCHQQHCHPHHYCHHHDCHHHQYPRHHHPPVHMSHLRGMMPDCRKTEGEEDGNSGDESVDECDSESDDDDEVVAFVDESDSETEVPVNTPGSTRTRAGRLSIPNSRYLDWLA